MPIRLCAPLLILSILFVGCSSTPPQQRVVFDLDSFASSGDSVVVAMTEVPSSSLILPGADCLLCIAAAAAMHTSLSSHAKTLTPEGIPELGKELGSILSDEGVEVSYYDGAVDIGDLPRNRSDLPNSAERDFSSLAEESGATHVMVVGLGFIGLQRNFASYVPTADPQARFTGTLMLVDLSTNTYDLYESIDIYRSAEGEWNEADADFPALTNAYYQALEQGKDAFRLPFYLVSDPGT